MSRLQATSNGGVLSSIKFEAACAFVVGIGSTLFLFISSIRVSGYVMYVVFAEIARPKIRLSSSRSDFDISTMIRGLSINSL